MSNKINRKAYGFEVNRIINEELPLRTEKNIDEFVQILHSNWEYQRVGNVDYNIPMATWYELMQAIKEKFPDAKTLSYDGSVAQKNLNAYPNMEL